jgi:hypothetical protein
MKKNPNIMFDMINKKSPKVKVKGVDRLMEFLKSGKKKQDFSKFFKGKKKPSGRKK